MQYPSEIEWRGRIYTLSGGMGNRATYHDKDNYAITVNEKLEVIFSDRDNQDSFDEEAFKESFSGFDMGIDIDDKT
jgi:hypothetical protein